MIPDSPTAHSPAALPPLTPPPVSVETPILYQHATQRLLGLVEGLTTTGFRLKGHQNIDARQFTARMEAPAAQLQPLITDVTVKWSEVTLESGIFCSHLRFDRLDEKALELLEQYTQL